MSRACEGCEKRTEQAPDRGESLLVPILRHCADHRPAACLTIPALTARPTLRR